MLTFILVGYCGDTYRGKPVLFESDEYWGEDLYLVVQDQKTGYDGIIVTQLPLCHDDRDY